MHELWCAAQSTKSTTASSAEMSCKRSNALFRLSNFSPRVESIAGPGTQNAPSYVLFIAQWGNWPIGSHIKVLNLFLRSHLMKFKISPLVPPLVLLCLMSLAINGFGPPMVRPSIKPMVKRLESSWSSWINCQAKQ